MEKKIKRLFNAIKNGKFNWERYLQRQTWYGIDVMTQPMFCSYGQIGYETYIYDERGWHIETISHDWDMNKTEYVTD